MKRYVIVLAVLFFAVLTGVSAQLRPAVVAPGVPPTGSSNREDAAPPAFAPSLPPDTPEPSALSGTGRPASAPPGTTGPAPATDTPAAGTAATPTPFGPPTTAAPSADVPAVAPEPGAPGYSPPPGHE